MLIALDPGHNCTPDVGCSGLHPKYPTEDKLTLSLANNLKERLISQGHEVIICLPNKAVSVTDSLRQRANIANKAQADLYISLHFNCFTGRKAKGTEVFAISDRGREYAEPILENLVGLGFRNRGVKNQRFLVLRATFMPAILIEVCFCDNQEDMDLYNEDKVAEAIALSPALRGQ